LMEVTRTGAMQSTFNFTSIAADDINGAVRPDRDTLGVGETPALYVLTPIPVPCPADIIGNGVVNVDDLLAVINGWGACNDPRNCPADIAPPRGNDTVNVDDLLAVINGWGACP